VEVYWYHVKKCVSILTCQYIPYNTLYLLQQRVTLLELLLLLVRLHDQSSSSGEVGGLLQVLQSPI